LDSAGNAQQRDNYFKELDGETKEIPSVPFNLRVSLLFTNVKQNKQTTIILNHNLSQTRCLKLNNFYVFSRQNEPKEMKEEKKTIDFSRAADRKEPTK
jgi:hypothetical protein